MTISNKKIVIEQTFKVFYSGNHYSYFSDGELVMFRWWKTYREDIQEMFKTLNLK